jgi:DNA-directed RNA polymerase specialized sigma24 family protein
MTDTDLSRIEEKLDTLIRLLALSVASDNHSLKDRAVRLRRAGMTPKEIAELCNTTPNTVSVALSDAKRESKRKRT